MGKKERFYVDIMSMHDEVTGSCNLVIVKLPNGRTIRFVVDCGLFQEKEYNQLNSSFPFKAENIDFCLITHVHVDHIGRLPLMVKEGFARSIYATGPSYKLLPLALADCFKVLNTTAKRKNIKPLYSESNMKRVLELLVPCSYDKRIRVDENITATFFKNGHLVGSSFILVQISYPGQNDINLLFTGDYNNKNTFFDVPTLPEWVLALPLTVIQESTYGDMDSNQVQECFENNILDRLSKGGTVVAPVFSLGRSQEILYKLKLMQNSGILDTSIPIYLDGKLAIQYTSLYLSGSLGISENMQNFLPENLEYVDKVSRVLLLLNENPKIILTTSGMGSYGPAQMYIPAYISRSNALIQFTGYTAEGTLGHQLQFTPKGDLVQIGGKFVKKLADVEYTMEYSAHAKADEMIEFLQSFGRLNLVLVNHGEFETKETFARRVADEVQTKQVGLLGKDYLFRVSPYGLVRTLSTKFK